MGELTMQRLAERLDVRRAAVHRHFSSREVLIAAVGEQAVASFQPQPIDAEHWRAWLKDAFLQLIGFMRRNPFVLALRSWDQTAWAILPFVEAAAETLVKAGFSEEQALHLWRMVFHYAYSAACSIQASPSSRHRYRAAERFSASGKFPHLAAVLPKLNEDPALSFARSLEWLLSGLPEPRATRTRKGRRK
ncbi:MAG TPA: TetR/AcrR family transcriptional regulator C-terminal domain-containing protein [Nevskiaceae bacterium]|nr:TetR/AcrR family transcriptional regulator C-terminal domain-containing protein [Nevskiaceae bacterium]